MTVTKSSVATIQTAAVRSSVAAKGGAIWRSRGAHVQAPKERVGEALLDLREIAQADQQAFLDPDYEQLHVTGESDILDINIAAALLTKLARDGKRIAIFGDYDVDGVCGTALLDQALRKIGAKTILKLPHRERDGYGLQLAAVPELLSSAPDAVVTVDNGSSSAAAIDKIKQAGVPVVVVDHHVIPAEAPIPDAFCNPKRSNETAGFRLQCATGVAFRLAEQMYRLAGVPEGQEKWLLDLVALATVCDMVPLVGDNRAFVQFGLKTLQRTKRPGLRALLEVSGVPAEGAIQSDAIGFKLGPRLNAAGRIEHAQQALEVVTATNQQTATDLAAQLDQINQRRKTETIKVVDGARAAASEYDQAVSLVLVSPGWPRGVCGLAAGRLARELNKPVFVLEEGELCVGSGRTAGNIDLAAMIAEAPDLFEKAGGHAAAAGCTLKRDRIGAFRKHFEQYVRDNRGDKVPQREHLFDLEIPLAFVDQALLDIVMQLAPFGQANPEPVFKFSDCVIERVKNVGSDERHVSFSVSQNNKHVKGIAFGMAEELSWMQPGARVDLLATVQENLWQNVRNAELILIDAQKNDSIS